MISQRLLIARQVLNFEFTWVLSVLEEIVAVSLSLALSLSLSLSLSLFLSPFLQG